MLQQHLHVVWNENAGSARENESLQEELLSRGNVRLETPQSAGEARTMAADAASGGARIVVAAGGDGTVNDVAQGLFDAAGAAVLGVIPLGTGNDFCRNAGIPLDPRAAIDLLEDGRSRKIDLVRVQTAGTTAQYINMATGGNTGLYTEVITDEMKQFWGPLVYLRGAVDVMSALQVFRIELGFDGGQPMSFEALNVFVANGPATGGGLLVAPDARLDDGLLDVIAVKDCTAMDITALATQYALADYRENENIIYRQCRSVSVRSVPALVFSTDGEVLREVQDGELVEFQVLPEAIRVITGLPER